ncbi:MAG TPA: hypothetical protein DCE42_08085 [Myxococcales bacterium]|nr:hypothetical protein [Deltaproteobacteria bacterium]MBU48096.1 hypothetical protein [Deltaproteobacteria bacterium]HAA54703.1 hypothetical protein [Myxococcales bacterium]|tara:strand:- start:18153 stop:19142 length:990 start_codon:yes stop_codon:yes gene_type:complete
MSETILVADENIQFLDRTRSILEQRGYHFLQATNGEEAKLKLELDPVDIFLVNATLPKLDGLSLSRFIREELQRPIPVALMVGHGSPSPTEDALAQVETLLQRPLKRKELLACVRSLLTIRKLLVQNTELRRHMDGHGPTPAPQETATPVAAAETPTPATTEQTPKVEEVDSLLYPMSWFRKLAALEVKRAIRFHQPLSLLLLAFDFTEEYLSHHAESELNLLAEHLAYAVKHSIRDIDIPVQFSRDHILMLLPNTGIEGAIQGASRIHNAITQKLQEQVPHELGPPSISIGATTSSTQGTFKFTDLLRDATRALREVRSQGGDGVFYC